MYGRPNAAPVVVAYTASAGTAVALPKGDWLLITASSAAWAQFGNSSGVTPVAKTAPAFLVGPWATYVKYPDVTPGSASGVGRPTHINAIQDAAGGTLSVVPLSEG